MASQLLKTRLKIVRKQPYAVLEDIYHVYCAIWSVVVGEILQCERGLDNVEDHYTVAVRKHEHKAQ